MKKAKSWKQAGACRQRRHQGVGTVSATLLLSVTVMVAGGCGASGDPGPRAGVHGQVTLDGQPLRAGAITFYGGAAEQAVTAVGFIENGTYRIEPNEGPLVGTARVRFSPQPVDQEAFEVALEQAGRRGRRPRLTVVDIPPHYGSRSQLTAEVTLEGDNRFDFHLRSRP